jgi:hypothetical protein
MNMKTKTGTEQILVIMYILTWVAFIGLMIETDAILISTGKQYGNQVSGEFQICNMACLYSFYKSLSVA